MGGHLKIIMEPTHSEALIGLARWNVRKKQSAFTRGNPQFAASRMFRDRAASC
jgi:hypothetical protein